ncbi:stage II sporulation protein P [Zongyangia hominis]|uniref:Stage II sporulation protein P n=1 Tax=Zongyangia hominis TaxID=2763677 RepID=A0A926EE11_9FIRM|nr:stage II sporulation protein P [Zongyangia hominis]MBC8570381.1 stage II sporulation protein P [Zongyangia hominis]
MRKRRNRRLGQTGKRAVSLCVLTAVLAVCIKVAAVSAPYIEAFTQKAAVLSAVLGMPDGGLSLIRQRFDDEIDTGEEESDPYVAPPVTTAPPSQSEPSSESESQSESAPIEVEEVPEEHRGPIVERTYTAQAGGLYIPLQSGFVKNSTKLSNADVQAQLKKAWDLDLSTPKEPTVLIYHTHATEAYEPITRGYYDDRYNSRSTEQDKNMIRVGDEIVKQLEAAGIGVLHDTTMHDYPSYNGAYDRSAETIQSYLDKYPSIRITIDVHRDAIEQSDGTRIAPVAEIDGKKAAQIMIISGCDDGTMDMPNWSDNLRFAAAFQSEMEGSYPGLTRPIFFCYRRYNMHMTPGSLLLEFGAHGNSLEEAVYSGELCGKALAQLILEQSS